MDLVQKIRECFDSNSVFYTNHAKFEMHNEALGLIFDSEVYEAISHGEIIEKYPSDKPYPSVLISGKTNMNRPLHIVCAYNKEDNQTIIITVYHPNPELWIEYKRRKKL